MTRPDRSRAPGKRSNATGGSQEGTKRHCTRQSNDWRGQPGNQSVKDSNWTIRRVHNQQAWHPDTMVVDGTQIQRKLRPGQIDVEHQPKTMSAQRQLRSL